MNRKITGVIISFALLFNICGYYFISQIEQSWVREEMKGFIRNGLFDKNDCEQITFTAGCSEVKWVDDNEIEWQGKMYDIVSCRRNGNQITCICINDLREEQLITKHRQISEISGTFGQPEKAKHRTSLQHHIIKTALTGDKTAPVRPEGALCLFGEGSFFISGKHIFDINPPPRES